MNNGDKKTGERLLKVIGLLQLEQTTFAQIIGVHRSSIYKIVDGVQRLSPSMMKRIEAYSFPSEHLQKIADVFLTMQLGGLVKIETAQQYIHLAKTIRDVEGLERVDW